MQIISCISIAQEEKQSTWKFKKSPTEAVKKINLDEGIWIASKPVESKSYFKENKFIQIIETQFTPYKPSDGEKLMLEITHDPKSGHSEIEIHINQSGDDSALRSGVYVYFSYLGSVYAERITSYSWQNISEKETSSGGATSLRLIFEDRVFAMKMANWVASLMNISGEDIRVREKK